MKKDEPNNEFATIALNILNSNGSRENQAEDPFAATINDLLATDCRTEISNMIMEFKEKTYSTDSALFLVAPNGNVYLRPPPTVDEDDIVDVVVVANKRLLPALKIRRTSAFRIPGVLNIVGGDQTLPSLAQRKSGGAQQPKCGHISVKLSDFQPGRAEVGLSVLGKEGEVPTGAFEFGVNTLYSGAFSFGTVYTQLKDPSFGLVFSNGDSLVTETENGAPRTLYTLTYTPFIWGKRDLEKNNYGLGNLFNLRRLNPMFGIVLNDMKSNFIFGASYDFASMVFLTTGAHLGDVQKLNPEADLKVGNPFDGTRERIPIVHEWDVGFFVGASLDLRAATQFFNKALGTVTGQ